MPDDRDATEQALDALVYGPVGFALYLRDTAPSFLKLFVARGRAVLDDQRKTVEGQLHQARVVGEFATNYGGPQVRRLVDASLSRAWERAEEMLGQLGTLTGTGVRVDVPEPDEVPDVGAAPAPAWERGGLAIPDYGTLSASQIVDRLEGLSRAELEGIREYETAHRARNTVLGKIDQLTRADR